jgi:integrase
MRAVDGLVAWMSALRRRHRWKWSTLAKNMATLQGALRLLPLYRATDASLALAAAPTWQMAMRAANGHAKAEMPRQALAATLEQVTEAAARCAEKKDVRACIILSWLAAGRVGDILKLHRHDVELTVNRIRITFRRGKTIRARGPYTIHSSVPAQFLPCLQEWFHARPNWLFPQSMKPMEVTTALRASHPSLESRSLRRGSLQTMAAAGVSEALLMEFSGHASIGMLRRYLQWGASGALRQDQMTTAALALARSVRA